MSEAARNAEMWWYICFGLACIATTIMFVGFVCVCYWLRRIHAVLRSDRFAPEKAVTKAPPLKY